jgi:glutamate-1-semialdehyde 2,1-aminomutase
MVSVKPPADAIGPEDRPNSVIFSKGVPAVNAQLTLVVPFNQPDALESLLTERQGDIAALILEPIMMNVGIVYPDPGYLAELRRITSQHGVALIFDEVKTGATIAAGGASEHYGVKPDLICLAKSIGGGIPIGAFAGSCAFMEKIRPEDVAHLGTFNGNPLAMRAGVVSLTQILTPDAYKHFGVLEEKLVSGCRDIIDRHELPMYSTGVGGKGCVMFAPEELHDYRDYLKIDFDLSYAHWLYYMNRGILMPIGADEQWTLSVQHTEKDIEEHLAVFEEFARDVMAA